MLGEMYGDDHLDGFLRANALSALVQELCTCSVFRTLSRTQPQANRLTS